MSVHTVRRILQRGEVLENVVLDGVELDECSTEQGPADALRPRIQNCTFRLVSAKRSLLVAAVLRDVTIDGLRTDSFSSFLKGNEFERVTIRGKIPELTIATAMSYEPLRESYLERLAAADRSAEWSLDISEALGGIAIRGYAADRIRIDPDTQAVVRLKDLEDGRWRPLVEGTLFGVHLDMMIRAGWQDTVLAAWRGSRRFAGEMEALRRLRGEGIIA